MFLLFEIPIFLALAFYLGSVFPTEFGVHKPWHFPITGTIKYFKRLKEKKAGGIGGMTSEEAMSVAITVSEEETKFEDVDVKQERARVTDPNFPKSDYPLVMSNMRKVYAGRGGAGPKLAVKDVTFAVEKGITFGLLGPNGAVKFIL
jgi:ABC-type glutathione transport system ATPase component